MSSKAKKIQERYQKGFVTDEQLKRYLDLGVITEEEYEEILDSKN